MLLFLICIHFALLDATSLLKSLIHRQIPFVALQIGFEDMNGVLSPESAKRFLAKLFMFFFKKNTIGLFEKYLNDAVELGNPFFNEMLATIPDTMVENVSEEEEVDDFVVIAKASYLEILLRKGPFYLFVKYYNDPFVADLMEEMNRLPVRDNQRKSALVILKFLYSLRHFNCFLYEEEVLGLYNEIFYLLLDSLLFSKNDFGERPQVFLELENFYSNKYKNILSVALSNLSPLGKRKSARIFYWTDYDWTKRINHFWQILISKWANSFDNFNWPRGIWQDDPEMFLLNIKKRIFYTGYNDNFDDPKDDPISFIRNAHYPLFKEFHFKYGPSTYFQSLIMAAMALCRQCKIINGEREFTKKFIQVYFEIVDEKYNLMTFNEWVCTPDVAFYGRLQYITAGQFWGTFIDRFMSEEDYSLFATFFGNPGIYVVAGIYGLLTYYIDGDEARFVPTVFVSLLAHRELEPIFHRIFDEILLRPIFNEKFNQVPLAQVLLTCLTCDEKRAKFLLSHERLNLGELQGTHLIHYLSPNLGQLIKSRIESSSIDKFPPINLGIYLFINTKLIAPPDEEDLFIDKEGKLNLLNSDVIVMVASGGTYNKLVIYKSTPIRVFPEDQIFIFSRKVGSRIPDTMEDKKEWIIAQKKKIIRQFKNIYYNRGGDGLIIKFLEAYDACRILIPPKSWNNK